MRRNLVDLMDDYLRLHAPIFTGLLRDFPEADGVTSCIGRREPVAFPTNREGRGYSLPDFEARAGSELKALVDVTMALQDTSTVTAGRSEPVSVSAQRHGDAVSVKATVSDSLGGIHALRAAYYTPSLAEAYFLFPAEIVLTSGSEDDAVIDTIRSATAEGFAAGVRAAATAGAILNHRWQPEVDLEAWLEAFPRGDEDPANFIHYIGQFHRISAESTHKRLLIMTSAGSLSSIAEQFPHHAVGSLEFDAGSLLLTP